MKSLCAFIAGCAYFMCIIVPGRTTLLFHDLQASTRARLGARALKNLADGTPPDDDLLVAILVDGVR